MSQNAPLPPGQYERPDFPRFGLPKFADRFPRQHQIRLQVSGEVPGFPVTARELGQLPRIEQVSDFHCVTTWSKRALQWSGVRFSDFFTTLVAPRAEQPERFTFVVLHCQDGYRTGLPLIDLMATDVLLADTLNGAPLPIEHGAPLRLVAPAHYGYKNPKHLDRIELWFDDRQYRFSGPRIIEHPRARVALEERGRAAPGWLLRYPYRLFVRSTVARFQQAMRKHSSPLNGE